MNCSPPGSQWDKIVRQEFYLISVQYIQRQLSTPILVNNCWLLLRRWVSNSTALAITIWTHFDRVSQKKDQNHKDVTRNSQMCHMSQNIAKDVTCHKESQGCHALHNEVQDVTRCTMKSRMSRVAQWSPGYHMSQKVVRDITCHTVMFSPWRWRWRNASVALGFHFSSFWQGLRSFLQCEWQVYS